MKKFKKCFSALFLSCFLAFGNISGCYLEVQAFEWVVPSLTVGDSILWLMGLLGIAYTEGASAWRDVSPEYEQDFIDYANEHGLTYTETSTWLNDTASGKLNQLSEVWANFKEWVKSKFGNSSSSSFATMDEAIHNLVPNISVTYNGSNTFDFSQCIYTLYINPNNGTYVYKIYYFGSCSYSFSNGVLSLTPTNTGGTYYYTSNFFNTSSQVTVSNATTLNAIQLNLSNFDYIYFAGFPSDILSLSNKFKLWEGLSDEVAENVYNPALIPKINFADANTEDASIPGVIDLPWGNLGEDEDERDKTYDDLVGGLDLGQEIGDLWQALQDLMGVLAVDDTGVLQPNGGGENPPTLEDEVEENKVNGAFVLSGLQKVFPFCIPFDLYAFMTLLVAEPVAPVINWPIYNPITDSNEIITIDFSTWESVVILLRYIFDFLFIVGLLLMARALIGGGDSA